MPKGLKFKLDDKVICVDADMAKNLTKGKQYVIYRIGVLGMVTIYDDGGRLCSYAPSRFISAEEV